MANDSKAYFSNSLVGQPSVAGDINLQQVDTNPRYPVGQIFQRADGNVYHYGYASGGVAAGTVVAPTFASAGVTAITKGVIGITGSTAVAGDNIAVGNAGSRFVEITYAGVTANLYRGGYFITSAGSGLGYTYRITGNTATGTPSTNNFRIQLKEPLQVPVGNSTGWIIMPCLWNDLIAADTSTNTTVAGVAQGTTTTTKPYGWFCTRGVTAALAAAANGPTLGQGVQLSAATNGALVTYGTGGSTVTLLQGLDNLGQCIQPANAASQMCVIFLSGID